MTTHDRPLVAYQHEVRAIRAGRQTQFRRVVKLREFQRSSTPGYDWQFRGTRNGAPTKGTWQDFRHEQLLEICPFGQPGTRLWVKEIFSRPLFGDCTDRTFPLASMPVAYRADVGAAPKTRTKVASGSTWKPASGRRATSGLTWRRCDGAWRSHRRSSGNTHQPSTPWPLAANRLRQGVLFANETQP